MRSRPELAWAGVTIVGVPAVIAALGGSVTYAGAFPLSIVLAALVFAVRRWPITALVASVATVMAYHIAGLIDTGWVWPATAAFFLVASSPRKHPMAWAIGTAGVALSFAPFWEPEKHPNPAVTGIEVLWIALVLAAAGAYRNWKGWQAETAQRVELLAQRNAAQERLLMARELHDVVAHTLTVVGVQLRVADEALDDSPQEARQALHAAQEVRGKAVADLRSLVDLLRDRQPLAPQGDLNGLEELIMGTRGVEIDFEMDGDPGSIPAPVALATYRIVQEALTNVVKHAAASRAGVRVRLGAQAVDIEVVDDGRGGDVQEGHGIAGMRERVTALGGRFEAGPVDGGFRVKAVIPVPA